MNTANFLSIPAAIFPDQEILVFEGARFTYGETLARVRRLAAALADLGLGRGDRIAALDTNSHHYLEAYYAAATLGATFVPLNYRAKLPELRHMLHTAAARAVIVGERYGATLAGLRSELPHIEHVIGFAAPPPGGGATTDDLIAAAPGEREESEVDEDDTTILMYTSGTTALPKGVMLTHHDFTTYVCGTVEMADGTPRGTALVCVPLYHIAGATKMMTTLFAGRRVVMMPQFDAATWLRLVEEERVTHAFVVPTMVKQLLDPPEFARRDLASLEKLSYGGAAMPLSVIRRAIEAFPPTVGFVNAFGQTETTSTLTVLGPDDHRLERRRGGGRAQAQASHLDRPAAARRRGQDRRRRRQRRGRQRCRRDSGAHAAGDEGLRRRHVGERNRRRRLAADARHGVDRRRRLRLPRRPQGRHDHSRRREHRAGRGRSGPATRIPTWRRRRWSVCRTSSGDSASRRRSRSVRERG